MRLLLRGLFCAALAPALFQGRLFAQTGRELAAIHCATCHAFPDPGLLDRETWIKKVLPKMAPHLGIHQFQGTRYPGEPDTSYPQSPVLSEGSWRSLLEFYQANSPESLARIPEKSKSEIKGFQILPGPTISSLPLTTLVKIDPRHQRIFTGDVRTRELRIFDQEATTKERIPIGMELVDLSVIDEQLFFLTDIGSTMPSARAQGRVMGLKFHQNKWQRIPLGMESLFRPVQTLHTNWDEQGAADFIICEYGQNQGGLSLFQTGAKSIGKRIPLLQSPGALKIVEEKKGSYLLLMAQGDERLLRVRPKGTSAEIETLLRFPPSYGVSDLEVADLDGDGKKDVLLAFGDNADHSPVFKPNHGIRAFRQNAQGNYDPYFFIPMDGATKVRARDFDKDGDLDLAVLSYFADFSQANHTGFSLLEKTGKNPDDYTTRSLPTAHANSGRWLTMDVADLDKDGDSDIVLGNYSRGPMGATKITRQLQKNWESGPGFLLLKNIN